VPIREADVSVLVPTYRRTAETVRALKSALATGAGEIVVSLNTDPDGSERVFHALNDSRLRIVVQPSQLGLSLNHLAALRLSSRPFVKFLQSDDHILPGGLKTLCDAFDENTTVVSGLPYYEDLETGRVWGMRTPSRPGRWMSEEYLRRAEVAGNELGRPSYTVFRRDALPADQQFWRDDLSIDWAANLVAASRGEVAIVERGAVVCGVHSAQDGATQGLSVATGRLVRTLECLRDYADSPFRRIVSFQAAAGIFTVARQFVGLARRGCAPAYRGLSADMRRLARLIDWPTLLSYRGIARLVEAVRFRSTAERLPVDAGLQATIHNLWL